MIRVVVRMRQRVPGRGVRCRQRMFAGVLMLLLATQFGAAPAQELAAPAVAKHGELSEAPLPRAINLRLRATSNDDQRSSAVVGPGALMSRQWAPVLAAATVAESGPESGPQIERLPLPEPARDVGQTNLAAALRNKTLAELSTDIQPPAGELPENIAEPGRPTGPADAQDPHMARTWGPAVYCWEAPAIAHHPLYFEDINVERHGHQVPFAQPILSAAHFFGRVPALPYLMALDCCWEHQYVLGHGRPGTCEACPIRRMPVTIGPSAVQAAVVTGLIFAIP